MTKYIIEFDSNYWQCGDGCCANWDTDIILNGEIIATYGFLSDQTEQNAEKFVKYINQENKDSYLIEMKIMLDECGELENYLYIDDTLFGKLGDYDSIYVTILEYLDLSYTVIQYDLDWDRWRKNKEIVLEVEYTETFTRKEED